MKIQILLLLINTENSLKRGEYLILKFKKIKNFKIKIKLIKKKIWIIEESPLENDVFNYFIIK